MGEICGNAVDNFFGVLTRVSSCSDDAGGEEEFIDSSILLVDLVVKLIVIIDGERDKLSCEYSSSSSSLFTTRISNFRSASRAYLYCGEGLFFVYVSARKVKLCLERILLLLI